jgi:hypothetical protein
MIATSWLAPDSWRARQESAIQEACHDGLDWFQYLRLVDRHRIPALSWAALKNVPGVPEAVAVELRRRSDACRMQAMVHLQMLAAVLNSLNRASIPVMPLKGPLLSLEMYGDVGLRQSKDLDILVAREDVDRTEECLRELGWRRTAEYSSFTPRQAEFNRVYERHIGFIHSRRGCELELHWRTSGGTPGVPADALTRATLKEWQGCSYLAMDPIDRALYLCNHGSEHAWARAKWLGDLARLRTDHSTDWETALEQAASKRQERAVLMCLRLLSEAYGLSAAEGFHSTERKIPRALINKAVRELTAPQESEARGPLSRLLESLRSYGYKRRLWPYTTRWEIFIEIAVCRLDFDVLRLPDRLFWIYFPLRPLLWVWRRINAKRLRSQQAIPPYDSGPAPGTANAASRHKSSMRK